MLRFVWLILLVCYLRTAEAIKLRVQNVECVHQEIAEENSLVSVVLVAGRDDSVPVFYDFVVRSPASLMPHCELFEEARP